MDRKKKLEIRKKANNVFEATKGFVHPPKDEAMKMALEMAGYVLELTLDVEGLKENPFACFGDRKPHIMDFDNPEEYRQRLKDWQNFEDNKN